MSVPTVRERVACTRGWPSCPQTAQAGEGVNKQEVMECLLCGIEFDEGSENELLEHLLSSHLTLVVSLALGLLVKRRCDDD